MSEDAPRYAIGIDLGTSNCTLSHAALGEQPPNPAPLSIPQIIQPHELGSHPLLPSFLYLPAADELAPGSLALPWNAERLDAVGLFARSQGASTPSRLVSSAKSWLSFAGVDRRQAILPWGSPEEIPQLSPLEASTRYLEHLRQAWNAAHPDAPLAEQEVVLTVPASFDAVARELTVEAANLAGLGENLRLLEEPQAALYAWVADKGSTWRDELTVGDLILVCDIGGGTTDFSLIAVDEEAGVLRLERIAVGEHILLGGDNMDLALAHLLRARLKEEGHTLDDWQMRALTHACRAGKEALLADTDEQSYPLVIPGRGSKLIGGTLRAELLKEELNNILLEGFLPTVQVDAKPTASRRLGLSTVGLPYASDAAITRHLAAFLSRSRATASQTTDVAGTLKFPTAILFNGGVSRSPVVRERIASIIGAWAKAGGQRDVKVLQGANPDLAVSRGAAYYAHMRRQGGVRIRGGTAQAYYVGVERTDMAIPGIEPHVDALCVAPFGMEEGSEAELSQVFGLVVGESVSFRFFGSASRMDDGLGAVADAADLVELAPIEACFEHDAVAQEFGQLIQVRLHARITEVGTLELAAVEEHTGRRYKLSFNVRVH